MSSNIINVVWKLPMFLSLYLKEWEREHFRHDQALLKLTATASSYILSATNVELSVSPNNT